MRVILLLYLLPLIVPAQAQRQRDTNTGIVSPPEECDSWISTIVSFDVDSSGGLSKQEFYTFLSSNSQHISKYYNNSTSLPWDYLVAYYAMACYCQTLGQGAGCCEGDVEIIIDGLGESNIDIDTNYKEIVCQQIAHVMNGIVPSTSPTPVHTESPVVLTTKAPVTSTFVTRSTKSPATSTDATVISSPVVVEDHSVPVVVEDHSDPTLVEDHSATVVVEDHSASFVVKHHSVLAIVFGVPAAIFVILTGVIVAHHRKRRKNQRAEDPAPEDSESPQTVEEQESGEEENAIDSARQMDSNTLQVKRRVCLIIMLSCLPFLLASISLGAVFGRNTKSSSNDEEYTAEDAIKEGSDATVGPITTNQTSILSLVEQSPVANSVATTTSSTKSRLRSASPAPSPP